MTTYLILLVFLFSIHPLRGEESPVEVWDLRTVADRALAHSPELKAALTELQISRLEEPLFLSELDTQLESGYQRTDDQSPRAAPLFEGTRSQLETFHVDLAQKTLIGTEARLAWANESLDNRSQFRVLDPSAGSILSLQIKQNLLRYLWGRPDVSRRKRYRSNVTAQIEKVRHLSTELVANATRAYLEVQFALQRVHIAGEGLAIAEKLLQSNNEKIKFGLVEESDVAQSLASVEAEKTEILVAQSFLKSKQNALAEIIGESISVSSATSMTLPVPLPLSSLDSSLQEALINRGDIKSLEASVQAAEWAARSEVLETLPQLSLNASYGMAGLDYTYNGAWDDLGGFDHPVKSIGFQFISPLGYRKEKLLRKNKKLELEYIRQNLERTKLMVDREVRDAWENVQMNRLRLTARENLVSLHRKKFIAERDNFRRGRSTTDILVRFQQEIHQAELLLARAQADQQMAEIDLARATGTLLSELDMEKNP
ncbi:MAG: hypothetical protein KCHDKBKB_01788 [Elusimicrobia bacterium]|nr:hypothetical protein [Elusimicrobiota bacterium]